MTWFVPGRVEVLGKHTDYAGGRSLLIASEQGVLATATPLEGKGFFRAESGASPDVVELRATEPSPLGAGHWGNYIQTVVDRLTLNFGPLDSAEIKVESTLPLASGMSSSSALMVAVALAIADQNDLWDRPAWKENIKNRLDLAAYAATIENGADFKGLAGSSGVGTFGGSQDHTAMINCHEGELTAFSYSPLREHASVPVPEGYCFAVAVSGVLAEKTGSALEAYNNVALRAGELVEVWNQETDSEFQNLEQVLSSSDDATEKLVALLMGESETDPDRPDLMERLLAYLTEVSEVIPLSELALARGDVEAFGMLVDLSHASADSNLHNQVPETNALQSLARDLGAVAASAFGAGFGGSVWAMVEEANAEQFAADWLAAYLEAFPEHAGLASTLVTGAGKPAHRVE